LTADLADLRALVGPGALEGTLRLQGQASGALTAITLQGTLAGQHWRYGDAHVDAVQLTYEGSQLGEQRRVTAPLETQKARLGKVPVEHLVLDATYASTVQQLQVTAEVAQSSGYSGKVRGSVHWTANGQQFTLDDLLVHLAGHPWRAVAPVEVTRDGQG